MRTSLFVRIQTLIKIILAFNLQAMGRVGEVICRTWQTADKMKKLRGRLSEEKVQICI